MGEGRARVVCERESEREGGQREKSRQTDRSATEWQRLVGCLKLQVIFRKRATDYKAFLREMNFEDKASYTLRHPVAMSNPSGVPVTVQKQIPATELNPRGVTVG